MTQTDKMEFYLMLDTVAEVFDVELSDGRKRAYYVSLADIPLPQLTHAFEQAIRSSRYFPVPAVLREYAGYGGGVTDQAEAAWIKLRNLETRYNREALTDPLIREVFEAMGGGYILEWGFGNWDLVKEDQKRREFLSRYREIQNARAIEYKHPERAEAWRTAAGLIAGHEEEE